MREYLRNFFKSRLNKTIVVISVLLVFMYVYSNLVGDEGAYAMFYIYIAVLLALFGVKVWRRYGETKDEFEYVEQIPMSQREYKILHKRNIATQKNYRFMAIVLWILSFILISTLLSSMIV